MAQDLKVNYTNRIRLNKGDIILLGYRETRSKLNGYGIPTEYIVLAEYIGGNLNSVKIKTKLCISLVTDFINVHVSKDNPKYFQFDPYSDSIFDFWKKATPKQVELYEKYLSGNFLTKEKLEKKLNECVDCACEAMKEKVKRAINSGAYNLSDYDDNYLLAKIMTYAILKDLTFDYEPITKEYTKIGDNISLFL